MSKKGFRLIDGLKDAPVGCSVSRVLDEHKQLLGLSIDLSGDIAHLPSSANNRMIRYRRTANGLKPYPGRDPKELARLAALTWHYNRALEAAKIPAATFGTSPVYCLALLAHKPGNWDAHNIPKALCDWLQRLGIVENDSQIEIHCHKKTSIPGCGDTWTTEINLLRWQAALPIFHRGLLNARGVARGDMRLYG